jgi:flagella basal body P-ring formation protein FlgA
MTFLLPLFLLAAEVPSTHPLDREVVIRAMRKTLAAQPEHADANLEIVDLSHFPVPDGEMEFDWKGLTPPATGQSTARWRGVVRHNVDHVYSIWAMVRLTIPCRRIIATQTIRQDEPIVASQLQEESYDGFPAESCNQSISDVIGKVATRTISMNTPVIGAMLAPPAAVLKGEQATAEYHGDAVWLSLPVIVERSGRIGEVIPVRNPVSHKILLAQVTGQGKVSIEGASGIPSLASGDNQ